MKKSLTILTIAILAIVAFASCVNAASVTVSPSGVEKIAKDQLVTVTLTTIKCQGVQFHMDFNKDDFVYSSKGSNVLAVNDQTPGTVFVSAMNLDGMTETTLTFKALHDIVVPEGQKEATLPFSVTGIQVSQAEGSESTTASGSLVITPTTGEPITPPAGDDNNTSTGGGNGGAGSSESETPVDKNGNPIKGLPNAGTPIFVGAVALIAVAGAILVIKNRK